MLRNLVSNAIKHGAPDTSVRVALRGDEADVHLEVTNRGSMDMPPSGELFEPLTQGIAQEGRDDRGSLGLGLFIVRELARAHHGDVHVRSEGGETTFDIRLPRVPPRDAGPHDRRARAG